MPQNEPTFAELLSATEHSAVHLEMRDTYAVTQETEAFAAWRDGFRYDPVDRASWWRPFLDLISETVNRGVVVRRARIVSEPVTEYIRYEHSGTFTNVAAGEQVRWLPRRLASDIALPGNDFWLFDGRLVRFHHFTGDGAWTADTFDTEPAVVKLCASAFETVWERATPHDRYTV
ncbi:DUF6879 family protein [Kitasatospora viridis]|uniref:DUF6879 domain-containing protein n=1 Tax=Kitasatospora viridis TaxID=281105 RepID=A0A561UC92_9ACTN|nr:DUF6879 family protein [Kitasatospora viridis]TWF96966.1 hypothetical protein FHX73_11740 [Kitasatospora viridis]